MAKNPISISSLLLWPFMPYIRLGQHCVKLATPIRQTDAGKPVEKFEVTAGDFEYLHGSYRIRSVLAGTTLNESLSEEDSEALDLQLVWARHPDSKKCNDHAAVTTAQLKEAWLWHTCAQAMPQKSFYRSKALSVSLERFRCAQNHVFLGGKPAEEMVERFAVSMPGTELSVEAWQLLARSHTEKARIFGGFHPYLGAVRQTWFRLGDISLTRLRPVYWGGHRTQRESDDYSRYSALANRAQGYAQAERARIAA